jgi:hypothetical protein
MAVTTLTWVSIAASIAVYVLIAGPLLAACLYAVWRRSRDPDDHAVEDVQRFIELSDRARAELAATGSLDRFMARKAEARAALWRSTEDGVPPPRPAPEATVDALPTRPEPTASSWEEEERSAA